MPRQAGGQLKGVLLRGADRKGEIVGADRVGCTRLLSLVTRGIAREIALINRDQKKADDVGTDVRYGAALLLGVEVRVGDYSLLSWVQMWMRLNRENGSQYLVSDT